MGHVVREFAKLQVEHHLVETFSIASRRSIREEVLRELNLILLVKTIS